MYKIEILSSLSESDAFELGVSVAKSEVSRRLIESAKLTNGFRLLVCGPGRAGKDTICQFLAMNTALTFRGSSSFAALPFIEQVVYADKATIYARRHEFRMFLFHFLNGLRSEDVSILPRMALDGSNIVCGVRSKPEMKYAASLCDAVIWVPGKSDPTMEYSLEDVENAIVINNKTGEFHRTAEQLIDFCAFYGIGIFPQPNVDFTRFGISFV